MSKATLPSSIQGCDCPPSTKEQPADGEPWVSAPIPEGDSNFGGGEAAGTLSGTNKPKALPLSVSQAARQGLAKVATPNTLQRQSQSHLGGYVYGLAVAADSVLPKPPLQKTTIECNGVSGNDNIAQRAYSKAEFHWGNPQDDLKGKPMRGVLQRSRSAGQSPFTPGRRAGTSGNSKSCPPARLKTSPVKEVMKHGGKARKDQVPGLESVKGDNGALKNKHSGFPLRRAGLDTSRKLDFFKKPVERSLQLHNATPGAEKGEGDVLMIDVESIIAAEEIRKQAAAVEQI